MRSIFRLTFLLTLTASLLLPMGAWAVAPCTSPVTSCISHGHYSFATTDYPYAEDIAPDLPYQVLTGPASTFTQIMGGCTDINGFNLNGTQSFNVLLRAMVNMSTTAAPGARYEVQLVVDGQQRGWYLRRLRGTSQSDVFTATALNLSPGSHSYAVLAKLDDTGSISFSNTYSSAFGTPVTNPRVASVNSSQISISNTFYKPVTDTVSFSNTQPVDFVIQGYFQVDSGTAGQTINIAPFLDGVRQAPITTVAVPPYLSDGVNFFSVLPNVPAGTHSVVWEVVTNNNTTLFSNRAIDGASFPASTYQVLAQDYSTMTVQSQATPSGPQPTFSALNDGCGYWTNILSGTIAPDPGPNNTVYEGFVNLTGASTGSGTWDEFSWETLLANPPAQVDGGNRQISFVPYAGGVYVVGDAMVWGENTTETINLWARKINGCSSRGGYGTFDVSNRYFWVRHTPITPATSCWYQ